MSDRCQYLCVDDQLDSIPRLLDAVHGAGTLVQIEPMAPKDFDAITLEIMWRHKEGALDGLLVDLKLDEPGPTETMVRYTAQGLAQQLRTLCSRSGEQVRGFPIVLWTVNYKLLVLYARDLAGHDLFDLTLNKEELVPQVAEVARQLVSLAEGYAEIAEKVAARATFSEIVGEPRPDMLDPRVADSLVVDGSVPTHEAARVLRKQLLDRSGPLLDYAHLCARFGVSTTSFDLAALLERLPFESRYNGPFHSAWPRWWSAVLDACWTELAGDMDDRPLEILPAARRVEILSTRLELRGLESAAVIAPGYSPTFTTICAVLGKPLDPVDGFALADPSPRPWLEKVFVSAEVALNPAKYDFRYPIDAFERKRLLRMIKVQKANVQQSRESQSD